MREILADRIKRHEGFSLKPYRDTEGHLTIGWGHNLDADGITMEVAEILFREDLKQAYEDYIYRLPNVYKRYLNTVQKEVIIELLFNMGLKSFFTFKKMLMAMADGNFKKAARELLDSKYHRQVGKRCEELAEILLKGEV